MADPISGMAAVGVVANILQLLEFTGKIAQEMFKICSSSDGTVKDRKDLELLVDEYQKLASKISGSGQESRSPALKDEDMDRLANRCKDEAGDLIKQLQSLKLDDSAHGIKRTWQGAVKATKAVASKQEIDRKHRNLSEVSGQLSSRLLTVLRSEVLEANSSILMDLENSRKTIVDSLIDSKNAIMDAVIKQETKVVKLLKSLAFPDMMQRRTLIREAHAKTYDWVLQSSPSSSFHSWLRHDNGLFWVSGKAGSGKSTLMKFMAGHSETRNALMSWSDDKDVVIADFYFWYLGSSMQKSIQGLLQSILYQILSRHPKLASVICLQRWATVDLQTQQATWTESELYQAIDMAAQLGVNDHTSDRQLDTMHVQQQEPVKSTPENMELHHRGKFCFFIDGLDEYDGDHIELAMSIRKWSKYSRFKLCVSSRPWNVFNTAFKSEVNTFRLEDLTRADIRYYVTNKLLKARAMTLEDEPPADEDSLVEELVRCVTQKAHGVFLWVFLVVKSLTDGLVEGDRLATLLRRVEALPSDLYEYFKQILGRIDGVYSKQTAQTLLLATNIVDRDPEPKNLDACFLTYWHLFQNDSDVDSAVGGPIEHCSLDKLVAMRTETQRFLSACCKDLLQVARTPLPFAEPSRTREGFDRWLSVQRVEFLHRTVYEFVRTKAIQSLLRSYSPSAIHHPDFRHKLALIRLRTVFEDADRGYFCFCSYFYDQAMQVCQSVTTPSSSLVQELDQVGQFWVKLPCPAKCLHRQGRSQAAATIYAALASHQEYRTLGAAMEIPSWNPYRYQSSAGGGSLLRTVLGFGSVVTDSKFRAPEFPIDEINHDLLRKLLDRGASPNLKYNDDQSYEADYNKISIWQTFLRRWLIWRLDVQQSRSHSDADCEEQDSIKNEHRVQKAASILLEYEASVDVPILHPTRGHIAAKLVLDELYPEWAETYAPV